MHAKFLLSALLAGVLAAPVPNFSGDIVNTPVLEARLTPTSGDMSLEPPQPQPKYQESHVLEARAGRSKPPTLGGAAKVGIKPTSSDQARKEKKEQARKEGKEKKVAFKEPEPRLERSTAVTPDRWPPLRRAKGHKRDVGDSHLLEARAGHLKPARKAPTPDDDRRERLAELRKEGTERKAKVYEPSINDRLLRARPPKREPGAPGPSLTRSIAHTPDRPLRAPPNRPPPRKGHKRDVSDSHVLEARGRRPETPETPDTPETPKTPKSPKGSKWPNFFGSGSPSDKQPPLDRSPAIKHERMPKGEEQSTSAYDDERPKPLDQTPPGKGGKTLKREVDLADA